MFSKLADKVPTTCPNTGTCFLSLDEEKPILGFSLYIDRKEVTIFAALRNSHETIGA